jgi:NAD-dependent SIR2 family protein deacetylase
VTGAAPNAGHRAVAALERAGLVSGIITQNVDGLHQAAGARAVTELHGSLHRVVCLSCWRRTPRTALDERLRAANPGWSDLAANAAVNPDGDVALEETSGFTVVDCASCGGLLKPDVVFFGENVPKPRVEACFSLVSSSSALVVLGSSLTVMSGLRYVRRASSLGVPVVIVNQGATRGDSFATATLDAPLGNTLTALVRELGLADSRKDDSLSLA